MYRAVIAVLFSLGSVAAQSGGARPCVGKGPCLDPAYRSPVKSAKPTPVPKKPDIVASISADTGVRTIQFDPKDMPLIKTKVKYTTVFALPKGEKIVDYLSGDVENWVINGADQFAYVKPAKAGLRTNLNLVTASGNVYSFLMVEGDGQPDLKVFVDTKDADMVAALAAKPKWVRAEELEFAQRDLKAARAEADESRHRADRIKAEVEAAANERIDKIRAGLPGSLRYVYQFKDKNGVFDVHAIAHDKTRTYIWATAQETPALYELKDKKPNLITFDYQNGVYIVDKILDGGYLAVGKHRMSFRREE